MDGDFFAWVECKGGMHGCMGGMWQHSSPGDWYYSRRQVFFILGVIGVFSPVHPPLHLHGQLPFTLDLYCAECLGLKGTKADALEILHVDSSLVLIQ